MLQGVKVVSIWVDEGRGFRQTWPPPSARPTSRPARLCRGCGDPFAPSTGQQWFCDPSCRPKVRAREQPSTGERKAIDVKRYADLRLAGICTSCRRRKTDRARCPRCEERLVANRGARGSLRA